MFQLKHVKVGRKFTILIGASLLGFIILLFMSATVLERDLKAERKDQLKSIIEGTVSQMQYLSDTYPEKQAKEMAKHLIDRFRYSDGDYIYVLNSSREVLVHPDSALIGQKMGESGSNTGSIAFWQKVVSMGDGGKSGTIEYQWPAPDGTFSEKVAYVQGFAPWGWVVSTGILIDDINAVVYTQILYMVVVAFIAMLAMITLGIVIRRSIVNPLHIIMDTMKTISKGNMTARVDYDGRDEIGMLGRGINDSISDLHMALVKSVESASSVSAASIRIASSAEETSQAVNSQQHQLSNLATAMNEMSATVSEVARHAEDTAEDTQSATQEANTGNKDVNSSVDSIRALTNELELANTKVNELKEGVMEISEVTAVISGISEQTNLLALNAAIEAARAGEQGRGFAVVADEVRNLASRTHHSTDEIQTTITRLQQLAVASVSSMEASQKLAYSSVERAENAGKDLGLIVTHIQKVNDNAAQIATAAEEQSVVAEDMNKNVSSINDSSSEMSTAANYLAKESEQLAGLSRQLDDELKHFIL
ncbi:methyl-accepting chemotaxis protein [Vibrio palustris]|uniref:Methyl-accepting chemotaxis protein 4 n=1 Tax=Vibrio palustris TaxID=1918946 RepID=A0A1R4B2T5_9VIBR|nr:methyl-accepting chemotaxis protein [Vibrio palustris]SJL83213.1 Methyl-accepting chemotaxis protein 4 [Vibrio palustris]